MIVPTARELIAALDEVDQLARQAMERNAELRGDLAALELVQQLDDEAGVAVMLRWRTAMTETALNAERDLVIRQYLARTWPWWRCLRVAARLVSLAWPWGRVWPPDHAA